MKRPNGTGYVYKRNATWTARVVDHYVPAPGTKMGIKPVYNTKGGFKTKRDALNYLPTLYEESPSKLKKAPTLGFYWDSYSHNEMEKLSKSKRNSYKIAWSRLAPLADYPVDVITVTMLREAVSKATSSYYTARDCKTLLSNLFKLAGADGYASKDLPSYIILPGLNEKERQTFTPDEQAAIWSLYEAGDIDAAIPLIMICTGMMPGELFNLTLSNIDLEKKVITGIGLKTKVRRESPIYLPDDIIPVLQDFMGTVLPSGRFFTLNIHYLYRRYYDVLDRAGCRRLEPYCCRHSTATRLAITEGIAPQTVQRIMRWASTKMLDRYAHPDAVSIRDAVNSITKVR